MSALRFATLRFATLPFAMLFLALGTGATHAATITLVPGAGFSDTTVTVPEGGNPGTTLGAQRTFLFQHAANVWGAALTSAVEIKIAAQFAALTCGAMTGTLGNAGATTFQGLTGGGKTRFMHVALAEAVISANINGTDPEISANFNSNVGTAGCLGGNRFYYGVTGPAPLGTIALYPVVLHEIGHGLGFSTLLCTTSGGCNMGTIAQGQYFGPDVPDTWAEFLRDNDTGSGVNRRWVDMTSAQRVTSFTHDPLLVWDGMSVTTNLGAQTGSSLDEGRLRMFAPPVFAGGSSLSHFHSDAAPNLLMEPSLNPDVFASTDLTDCLFADIGWENSRCATVINTEPTLDAIANPAAIPEDAAQQTVNLTGIGDADAIVQAVSIAATSGTTGLIPNPTVTFTSGNATGTLRYTPVANQSGSAVITVTVTDDGGVAFLNGGDDTLTRTFTVNVSAVNDAPVLDAARSPVLAAVNEDALAPVGAVGTTVSALVDFATPAGQVDNVTDVDAGALLGIAITAADGTNGTWRFSTNGGANWSTLGSPTDASSRLLTTDPATRVHFQPNTDFAGSATVTFRAWDRASGANGGTADTSTNGGTTPYSIATDTASVSVTAINDAPVLDASKSPVLAPVAEESGAPVGAVGTLVSALVDFASPGGQLDNVTDADAGALLGIAITAADAANGTWHFSTNGGTNWSLLGTPSSVSSRILAADAGTRLYFQPAANFAGSSSVTFRAWDRAAGTNGATTDTTTNGGTTPYSTATDTASVGVTDANDAPTLDATKSPALGAIAEDSGAPGVGAGSLVSTLVDFASPAGQVDNVTDPDAGALLGIAIVGSDPTNGAWSFSTNGGTSWTPLGNPGSTTARLLAADAGTRLYYQPNTNVEGLQAAVLQFRAWDQTTGLNGGTGTTATSGGTTAFSTTIDTVDVTVSAVNDAPVLDASKAPTLGTINEDAGAPSGAVGTLVSALVDSTALGGGLDNVTDVDAGAQFGIAVTASDTGNGTLFYTTNGGTNWIAVGSVSDASARLLAADASTRVYFEPALHVNGALASAITFRAWDRSSGANGALASATPNGGTTAFSSATDTAALAITAVNDAPQLNSGRSPQLNDQTQNDPLPVGAVGTLVSALVDASTPSGQLDNVFDPDGAGALLGVSLNATNESNGAWFYSTNDGGVWDLVGPVTLTNARLLAADGVTRLYFRPNTGFSGTIADGLTFRAWDRTSGTNGGLASNGSSGGTTAFSNSTDTASVFVTPVDVAPQASAISPNAFPEDTESVITLDYSDANGDPASECAVALVVSVDVTTQCACSAGTCTVGVTGTPDYSGPGSFVYQVTANGAASNTAPATLSITPVNDEPTLDAIADPAAVVAGTGAKTVSLGGIGAGGGEVQALAVMAESDNASVVGNVSVAYTSPGTTGTVSFTPLATGTASVTVTVTDDGGTGQGGVDTRTRTFGVEVRDPVVFGDGFENP